MPDAMTKAVRDDLARLAYAVTNKMTKADALAFLAWLGFPNEDDAKSIYARGQYLARREKGKAA